MESLIATRHKVGYILNIDRKNVLVLSKRDLTVISACYSLMMDRFRLTGPTGSWICRRCCV